MTTGMSTGPLVLCFVLMAKSSLTSGFFMPPPMPPMPPIPRIQFPSTFPFNNGGSFSRTNSFSGPSAFPSAHQVTFTSNRMTPQLQETLDQHMTALDQQMKNLDRHLDKQMTNLDRHLNQQAKHHAKQIEKEMDRQEKQMHRQRKRVEEQFKQNQKELAKRLAREERQRQIEEMARLQEQEQLQAAAIVDALREVNWANVQQHVKELLNVYNVKVEDIPVKVVQAIPSDTRDTIMNVLDRAQKFLENSLSKTENGDCNKVADDKMVQAGIGVLDKRDGTQKKDIKDVGKEEKNEKDVKEEKKLEEGSEETEEENEEEEE
uniref:Uncharacterized protein n=2 Tax=Cacopsylla melanoneura TaxID=428564 RepID=A0A8D8XK17_9HEMI